MARSIKKIRPPVEVPTLVVTYNDTTFYVAVIPSSILAKCASVSTAKEDPEAGYQRLLNPNRAKQISEYLKNGHVIPGALILASCPEAQLAVTPDRISFQAAAKAFLVIDGQHRLFGATQAGFDVPMVCCIVPNLGLSDQVQYFLDINGTQRGVPKTLRLEIEKFLKPEDSKEARRIRLFKRLDVEPESPMFNKMSSTETVRGKISHVSFDKAIMPLLDEYPLNVDDDEKRFRIVLNYLKGIERVLEESSGDTTKLTNAVFFQALFACFGVVTKLTLAGRGNLKVDSFYETMKPLEAIDWAFHSGTNSQTIVNLTQHMKDLVEQHNTVDEDLL